MVGKVTRIDPHDRKPLLPRASKKAYCSNFIRACDRVKNKLQITVKPPPPDSDKEGYDLFTLWKEYEAIAMHFNDLLLKLRTQSLAAVAAFATVAGVLLKSETGTDHIHWAAFASVFAALTVFWIAIWILDFAYYNRLLLGAVKALVWIERTSKTRNRVSGIYISTLIEQAVARRKPEHQARVFEDPEERAAVLRDPAKREDLRLSWGRWAFYLLVFGLLASATIGSFLQIPATTSGPATRSIVPTSR